MTAVQVFARISTPALLDWYNDTKEPTIRAHLRGEYFRRFKVVLRDDITDFGGIEGAI